MKEMSKTNKYLNLVFIFTIMMVLAIENSLRGILLPLFEKDFAVGATQLGAIISASYAGTFVFNIIVAFWGEKFRKKNLIMVLMVLFIVALLIIVFSNNYVSLLFGFFLTGGCSVAINIQLNILTPLVFAAYQGVLISMLHFFYSMGITLTQTGVGQYLGYSSNWKIIYVVLIGIMLVLLACTVFNKFSYAPSENKSGSAISNFSGVFKDKRFYIFGLMFGLYNMAEHGTMNWFLSYLHYEQGFAIEKASIYVSIFFATLAIGRLFGGILTDKFNKMTIISLVSIGGLIFYFSGIIAGGAFVILVSLSGIFFSIIYPTMMLMVKDEFSSQMTTYTSMIICVSTIINITFNNAFGKVVDVFGYGKSFYVVPLALLAMLLVMGLLKVKVKSENVKVISVNN